MTRGVTDTLSGAPKLRFFSTACFSFSEIEKAGSKTLETLERKTSVKQQAQETYLQDIASGSQKLKVVATEKAETKEKAASFLGDIKKLGDE